MATELSGYHTLIEFGNRHKNKYLIDISKTLKANPLITDAVWKESNDLTKHTHGKTVKYPEASVRMFNKGIAPTTAQTQPFDEPLCTFEQHINIDELFEDFEKDFEQYRYDEELKQMEGFSRTMMKQFLSGDPATTRGEVKGILTRYNDPSTQENVLDNGSTTDGVCSSVLVVKWGADGLFLPYPQGDPNHGIKREPRGKVYLPTATGLYAWHWNTVLKLTFGICVSKDVAVQRLGSIDTTNTVDPDKLVEMCANITEEYGSYDGCFMYMNARTWAQLWKENNATPGLITKSQDSFGNPIWAFDGMPIKLFGGLTKTENDI